MGENTRCSRMFHKSKLTSVRFKMRFAILVMALVVLMADARDNTNDAPECHQLKLALYDARSKVKSAIDKAKAAKDEAEAAEDNAYATKYEVTAASRKYEQCWYDRQNWLRLHEKNNDAPECGQLELAFNDARSKVKPARDKKEAADYEIRAADDKLLAAERKYDECKLTV